MNDKSGRQVTPTVPSIWFGFANQIEACVPSTPRPATNTPRSSREKLSSHPAHKQVPSKSQPPFPIKNPTSTTSRALMVTPRPSQKIPQHSTPSPPRATISPTPARSPLVHPTPCAQSSVPFSTPPCAHQSKKTTSAPSQSPGTAASQSPHPTSHPL